MKTKASSSKICVLLAFVFFLNPVIATAGTLFSELNALTVLDESALLPCHEESDADTVLEQNNERVASNSDCCTDICLCDDASCQTSSLVFQSQNSFLFNTLQP